MDFLRSGIGEGLNEASGTVLNTGMDLMKFKQQQAAQNQQMSLANERAQREKLIFDREEQKRQEAEARYNTPVAASRFFPKIREFPSFRQSIKEGFEALGLPYEETPDGDIIGKQGHGQEVLKWIAGNEERSEAQAKGMFGDLQTKKMALIEQLANAKKPEDQKAINDQLAILSEQQAQVIGASWKMQEEIQKNKLKEKEEKPLVIPEGGVLMGEDGKPIYKNPKTFRPQNITINTGGKNLSPAEIKRQEKIEKETVSYENTVSELDRLADEAKAIMNDPALGRITGIMGVVPNMPGSKASDIDARMDTLKSQVAFGVLQNMRNMSKTGGALGQVSDKEIGFLQANLAGLDKAQSEKAMKNALQRIVNYTEQSKKRYEKAFTRSTGKSESTTNVIRYDSQGNRI